MSDHATRERDKRNHQGRTCCTSARVSSLPDPGVELPPEGVTGSGRTAPGSGSMTPRSGSPPALKHKSRKPQATRSPRPSRGPVLFRRHPPPQCNAEVDRYPMRTGRSRETFTTREGGAPYEEQQEQRTRSPRCARKSRTRVARANSSHGSPRRPSGAAIERAARRACPRAVSLPPERASTWVCQPASVPGASSRTPLVRLDRS